MNIEETKSLKQICSEMDIWNGWLKEYQKFVPQFIEEAINGYSGDADPPCPVMLTPHKDYGSKNLND